ncbi:hypothetical protein [Pedobacter alpinus]|uniref:Uncharacterized protein n=1 Tax=Pedobacter alpinus TaxID=1590643 RepID=A0ABW5TXQ6_9SPHI
MKKLTTSVSPFLMMIIPVLFIVGLSFTIPADKFISEEGLTTTTITKNATQVIVKGGQKSFVKFLLKK